jgi:nicotinamidase-related amidase
MPSGEFDFSKSALIVYNMQKGNPGRKTLFPKIIPNVRKLIDAYHKEGRPVIYGQHISLAEEYQPKYYAYWLRWGGHHVGAWSRKWADGSPATEIIDEVKPGPHDCVIKKHVASFFVETNAEVVLRSKGVETIVLCGVTMEHGLDSTARHASFLGFMPVIVEDAVESRKAIHKKYSLALMKDIFACEILKTDDVIKRVRGR